LQGGFRLCDCSVLQSDFTLIARVGTKYQTDQREADCTDRTNRRDHREDHGWQRFVGPGLVVFPETPTEPRAEKAD
jgi:hypothetical protein